MAFHGGHPHRRRTHELLYHSRGNLDYLLTVGDNAPIRMTASVDDRNSVSHTYTEVLPKLTALYAFDDQRNLYVSVSKGYKAGGFNTQLFSDILQEKLKGAMLSGSYPEQDILSYRPEYNWNYELGGHFSCMEGAVRGDFALFYIDCRDQQLTVFPRGSSTGRMMTNAGRTRSIGAELALQCSPWRTLDLHIAYGYTDARFVRYDNGQQDFNGNFLPYAPSHTLTVSVVKTFPTGVRWLATSCYRPVCAARAKSAGTRKIHSYNRSTRCSTPRCASNTDTIRWLSGAATSPTNGTMFSISNPSATSSCNADGPEPSA